MDMEKGGRCLTEINLESMEATGKPRIGTEE